MNSFMCALVLIAVFGAFVSANPVFEDSSVREKDDRWNHIQRIGPSRIRRSPQNDSKKHRIYVDGNHDRRAGTNIYVQGQTRLWQSQNKRNEIHAQGSYGQHFGGPSGRSPPSYGAGLTFTRRF